METDILVVGAGPAGLAVAAALIARGHRPLVIEKGAQVGASWRAHTTTWLRTVHTVTRTLGAAGACRFRAPTRATCRASASSTTSMHTPRAPGIAHRASKSRQSRSSRPTAAAWQHDDDAPAKRFARARSSPADRRELRIPFVPEIPGQEGFAGENVHSRGYRNAAPFRWSARVHRRRHGQHRRRDRPRPRRARRRGRALGALAGQHRPSRRPRPADAAELTLLLWRLPTALGERTRQLALRYHRRRPRPLRPAPLDDLAAARAARTRPHGGDRRRHAGADQGRRDRRLSRDPSALGEWGGVRRRPQRAVRGERPRNRVPLVRIAALLPQVAPCRARRERRPAGRPAGQDAALFAGVYFVGFDMRQPGIAAGTIAGEAGVVAGAIGAAAATAAG